VYKRSTFVFRRKRFHGGVFFFISEKRGFVLPGTELPRLGFGLIGASSWAQPDRVELCPRTIVGLIFPTTLEGGGGQRAGAGGTSVASHWRWRRVQESGKAEELDEGDVVHSIGI
jgi:hypothetical protein